jgi:hypothetical protein
VNVTVATDNRLGFAPRERRRVVGARFTERVDPKLRGELAAVVAAVARQLVARLTSSRR